MTRRTAIVLVIVLASAWLGYVAFKSALEGLQKQASASNEVRRYD